MTSFFNWFLHRSVRHARQMSSHARKLVAAQRDILTPQAVENVERSIQTLEESTQGRVDGNVVMQRMADLEKIAVKWLKPYPNASYRENVEVLLVAIAVAMGIRTFFLQPFKIPTGSMQPTLFGVTAKNHLDDPNFKPPNALVQWKDFLVSGTSYFHVVAHNAGVFSVVDYQPSRFLLFNLRQRFKIDDEVYTVWFPPENLWKHAGFFDGAYLERHPSYKVGDDIIKMQATSGDHLFVDRMTYNFRRPARGDIVVFKTEGIRYPGMTDDQHYIKRLIGLSGETVQIGNDRHVRINGVRLDASTPHFSKVYDEAHWRDAKSSVEKLWPEDGYMGHVNSQYRPLNMTFFNDENFKFVVPPKQYLVMGDNTLNSSDSRYWGSFPSQNVIGKSFFVYWPFNVRFAWWGHD